MSAPSHQNNSSWPADKPSLPAKQRNLPKLDFSQAAKQPTVAEPSTWPAANSAHTPLDMIRSHSSGQLKFSSQVVVKFEAADLLDLGEIGQGAFGTVNKMVHHRTGTVMAVKRIHSTMEKIEEKQLLMDLEVIMRADECPYIVQFFGAIFKEGDCWICMELMATSLEKLYKTVYDVMGSVIPEPILGKVSVSTLKALNYLKEELKIIHRDVKPSNILLDERGHIKLCDFGIAGKLVDSMARTRDAGCRPYMAPERIDPKKARGYDIRSDVWSLGITLIEVATGRFPYPSWNSVFDQLQQVVDGDPPALASNGRFSPDFIVFVNHCLIKDETARPKYRQLMEYRFIKLYEAEPVDVASYVSSVLAAAACADINPSNNPLSNAMNKLRV